jgi:hypothetical protein
VLAADQLSAPDKRRMLLESLVPRLTDGYVIVLRDMLRRIPLMPGSFSMPSHRQPMKGAQPKASGWCITVTVVAKAGRRSVRRQR